MKNMPAVIITGASRGLGAAIACWLGKAGAGVALIARCEEKLAQIAKEVKGLGGEPLICATDISNPAAGHTAVEKTLNRFGRLDALVNNAGIVQPISSIALTDPDAFRYNIEVNFMGPFYLIHAAISELRRTKGRIVNVSSGAANRPLENISAYCATKAALNHFTRVLAAEEPDVTSLTIRPGVVDTDMQAYIREQGPKSMSSNQIAYYIDLKERGDLEPPEIPGRSIAWLALHAPPHFSGRFLDYDDPRISQAALEIFGDQKQGVKSALDSFSVRNQNIFAVRVKSRLDPLSPCASMSRHFIFQILRFCWLDRRPASSTFCLISNACRPDG
ncbi:MAG: SDR family NAD(P)-dependent oxidoreductase [Desulfobacteraceae bacterium]|jgi:NAD(P)-dependent dehydrogenase (short-subunit alcohol dehydrogenase family)